MPKPTLYKDNAEPKNLVEALQNGILNRFFKPYGKGEPIVYEFTQDRGLLHQYYLLREAMYRRMFETDKFVGEEDVHDKLSHILVARRGRLCLGGCRLTVREPDEMWSLPMESDDFKLRSVFPDLALDRVRHGEISRFAVMEDCGSEAEIFSGLCEVMYEKVISLKVHYLFAKSTYTLARNWRLIANRFGARTTRICSEVQVPENPVHPGVKWYITHSDLSSLQNPSIEKEGFPVQIIEEPRLALID